MVADGIVNCELVVSSSRPKISLLRQCGRLDPTSPRAVALANAAALGDARYFWRLAPKSFNASAFASRSTCAS
jgi:hypothetical protein